MMLEKEWMRRRVRNEGGSLGPTFGNLRWMALAGEESMVVCPYLQETQPKSLVDAETTDCTAS